MKVVPLKVDVDESRSPPKITLKVDRGTPENVVESRSGHLNAQDFSKQAPVSKQTPVSKQENKHRLVNKQQSVNLLETH